MCSEGVAGLARGGVVIPLNTWIQDGVRACGRESVPSGRRSVEATVGANWYIFVKLTRMCVQ